jgi:hypothetical protein
VKEEDYALPPLGWLPGLAEGKITPEMGSVLGMTDRLKEGLPEMLEEHKAVVASLKHLAAILREIEAFILELGVGFTFVARQKRITVDEDDFYLDLLFFHRNLRRLVAPAEASQQHQNCMQQASNLCELQSRPYKTPIMHYIADIPFQNTRIILQ